MIRFLQSFTERDAETGALRSFARGEIVDLGAEEATFVSAGLAESLGGGSGAIGTIFHVTYADNRVEGAGEVSPISFDGTDYGESYLIHALLETPNGYKSAVFDLAGGSYDVVVLENSCLFTNSGDTQTCTVTGNATQEWDDAREQYVITATGDCTITVVDRVVPNGE